MAGRNTNIGAKRARETRKQLGLDPAAPITCLLSLVEDDLGIPVSFSAMPEGVEGLCWQLNGTPMLWVNAHEVLPRRRFTLAHELGHLRCGHDASLRLELYTTVAGKTTSNAETQANAFAAEFLAPAAGITRLLDGAPPTLERVVEISARFGISTIAAAFRCTTLGLVDTDATLKAAIEAGADDPVWAALNHPPDCDGLACIKADQLPRLSPLLAGSGLASLLRGEASVDDVAAGAGVDPQVLTDALALLGV